MAGSLARFPAALAAAVCLLPVAARALGCGGLPAAGKPPPLAILPVTVRPVQCELTAVPATDGHIHLAFAAQVTNLGRETAKVLSIIPVNPLNGFQPTGINKVLDSNDADITGKVRLFSPPTGKEADFSDLPAGASGMTFFDITYARADDVPGLVSNRITVEPGGAGSPLVGDADPVAVSREPPVILSPPLVGDRWWNGNGCCEVVAPHRGATLPVNGDIRPPEQFAIDWVQLTDQQGCCTGPVADLNSWPFFRAPILAAAAGVVVMAVNNEPEQVPGPPKGITADNAPGNNIIEDIGNGRFITVRASGDRQHPALDHGRKRAQPWRENRRAWQHRQFDGTPPAFPGDGPGRRAQRRRAALRVRPPDRRGPCRGTDGGCRCGLRKRPTR